MRKFILLVGTALGLTAGPASACDLDGMFGPHRFNAFANMGGQSMFEADPQPMAPPQAPEPKPTDTDEPADGSTRPTTFAILTDRLNEEPTDPSAADRPGRSSQATPRESDGGSTPSAMFR